MTNYMQEVDCIVKKYRNKHNTWETELASKLVGLSSKARKFICEFMDKWDKAVIADATKDYSIMTVKLKEIISSYSNVDEFSRTVLYTDMTRFISVEKREHGNDRRKGDAQGRIYDDIEVLRFCNEYWDDKIT